MPVELDAPTCNYRNRHGARLTVPRGIGPPATHLRREMRRKAAAAVAAIGLTASETVRLLFHRIAAGSGPCRSVIPFHADHPGVSE